MAIRDTRPAVISLGDSGHQLSLGEPHPSLFARMSLRNLAGLATRLACADIHRLGVQGTAYRKGESNPRFEQAFTLLELLIVISVICSLIALLIPVTSIVRDSTKHQQARSVVSQLVMGLTDYACEDPSRSMPPSDADHVVHSDPTGASFHILDAMIAMHLDGGLHPLVADPSNSHLRTLIDPWRRPYRYQLDTGGAIDWNNVVQPIRPDPARSDWNAKNQVPFGYVWSLGRPVHGTSGQWLTDPDAAAGSGAPWIYLTTSPSGTTP